MLSIIGIALVAAVLAGLIILYGPSRATAPSVHNAPFAGSPVAATVLAQGAQSAVAARTNYLITSDTELRALWQMLSTNDPVPTVDFTQHDVIALFAGTEPTAGYVISAQAVRDSATERLVEVQIAKPGVSCLAAQTQTAPYVVVLLPKSALPLSHTDTATTTSCLQ